MARKIREEQGKGANRRGVKYDMMDIIMANKSRGVKGKIKTSE